MRRQEPGEHAVLRHVRGKKARAEGRGRMGLCMRCEESGEHAVLPTVWGKEARIGHIAAAETRVLRKMRRKARSQSALLHAVRRTCGTIAAIPLRIQQERGAICAPFWNPNAGQRSAPALFSAQGSTWPDSQSRGHLGLCGTSAAGYPCALVKKAQKAFCVGAR